MEENSRASKKLINSPENVVDDCLEGFALRTPGIRLLKKYRIIFRSDLSEVIELGRVCLISGGGSGHEPSQAGFVGKGMLTAAVCGNVFASPPVTSILKAINICHSNGGVLLIVTNYTGDRLNFGCAAEIAEKAKQKGINVEMVIVDDDAADTGTDQKIGRRGLCGTVFVHKVAGALAEMGHSLQSIASFVRGVIKDIKTISISMSPCSLPGQVATFCIPDNAFEFGLGVHGEPGIKKLPMMLSSDIAKTMCDYVLGNYLLSFKNDNDFALIVNNLGTTSTIEMHIFLNDVVQHMKKLKVRLVRVYVGCLMTSLEMSGVSISLLRLNEKIKYLLDADVSTPFKWVKGLVNV